MSRKRMSNQQMIRPEKLTAEAFAPYGNVIEATDSTDQRLINDGHTVRFHDLAKLDLTAQNGVPLVSIFRSTPLKRPVTIRKMERHPLSSQAFYPLGKAPYLVVVCEKGDFDPDNIKVFLASADQGVNYHAGTWHHYSLALNEVSDFLVIDRGGPEENCDEIEITKTTITITIEY